MDQLIVAVKQKIPAFPLFFCLLFLSLQPPPGDAQRKGGLELGEFSMHAPLLPPGCSSAVELHQEWGIGA